jgi:DNA-directed RNA polymerase subunit L
MEVKIIKDEKENLVFETDNQTIAELVRVYLNKDSSVEMAAWKRESPDKPVVMEIITKGKAAKSALEGAIKAIEKDASKYVDEFKKAK